MRGTMLYRASSSSRNRVPRAYKGLGTNYLLRITMANRKIPRSIERAASEPQHSPGYSYQAPESTSSDTFSEEESSDCIASTRTERRAKAKALYMKGKSRKPYHKSKHLESSLEESGVRVGAGGEPSHWNVNVCKSCAPVLVKYAETFNTSQL